MGFGPPEITRCGNPQARLEGHATIRPAGSFLSPGVVPAHRPCKKSHLQPGCPHLARRSRSPGLTWRYPQIPHKLCTAIPKLRTGMGGLTTRSPQLRPHPSHQRWGRRGSTNKTWAQLANKLGMAVWTDQPRCGQIRGGDELSTFRSTSPQLHPPVMHSQRWALTREKGSYPQNPQDLLWPRTSSLFYEKDKTKEGGGG